MTSIKIRCLFFFFIAVLVSGLSADVNVPIDPENPIINETRIPDVVLESPDNDGKSLSMIGVQLDFSHTNTVEGIFTLSNHILFTLTNLISNTITIKSYSIFNIDRLEVLKWKAERKDNSLYLFTPVLYAVYTNETGFLLYNGNISALNRLEISQIDKNLAFYSLFYDKWIEGKKGVFRWENSRTANFSYNLDHPINGVVVKIRFINR